MRRLALVLAWLLPLPLAAEGDVISALSAPPPPGFLRADAPREFSFPKDHGPHMGYRTEWWYVTGLLRDPKGRRFGYELTIFRSQLSPKAAARKSEWATNQVYMAHFAVTDVEGGSFSARERFARGAQGLAGSGPGRIWLEDWEIDGDGKAFPVNLKAADGDQSIELSLHAERPIVLNGDRGLSRKGAYPGDASYYYSIPRLRSEGKLTLAGHSYEVAGVSWLDREWSTSALSHEQSGWDWFALHLDDGRDLMFYRLRRKDGSTDPHSGGTLIDRSGRGRKLSASDVKLEPVGRWKSYPAGWKLSLPSENLSLDLTPWLADQELKLSFPYWEGAVAAKGSSAGRPASAEGYLEMTGY